MGTEMDIIINYTDYYLEDDINKAEYAFHLSKYLGGRISAAPDIDGPGCYIFMVFNREGKTGNLLFDVIYIGQGADKGKRIYFNPTLKKYAHLNCFILTTTENRIGFGSEAQRKAFEEHLKFLMPVNTETEHWKAAELGRDAGHSNMIAIRGDRIYLRAEKYREK